jgi:nucleotide-binding universal stress UspA family protein
MDYSKLKRRASYPFETIAVAVAFSPRLEAIVTEGALLAKACNAKLLLIHIGERTRNKESKLDDLVTRLQLKEDQYRILWNDGDPVDSLLHLCKLNVVDLIILGAMKKESLLQYYLGSVARKISRKAKCSVLLLTDPSKDGTGFKKMVVNGVENPKTVHTINTAVYFGKCVQTTDVFVVTEIHQPGLAMTMADEATAGEMTRIKKENKAEELERVHAIVTRCQRQGDMEICEKTISGKPGYAIRHYAEQKKANLLVVNSPDQKLGIIDRIFTHDIEYILEDLPCNVLIVHSRVNETV